MNKFIEKEKKKLYKKNEYIKQLEEHYAESIVFTDSVDLVEFFELDSDQKCDIFKKHIESFPKNFTPIFKTEDSVVGYFIETTSLGDEVYFVQIDSLGYIDFFGKATLFEFIALELSRNDSEYKHLKNRLSLDNIIIREKQEIEKSLVKDKKESELFKRLFLFFVNFEDLCKYGRAIDSKKFTISNSEYKEWMYPRYGDKNPTKVKSKIWEYGVASRKSAYSLKDKFNIEEEYEPDNPSWCFDRFGKSITFLDDGTEIHIAGEHEDYYDPDFYIYNDVTVIYPDDSMDFCIYPKNIFPPTDFHSATLIDNTIVIIGSLGYLKDRKYGYTQVYELNLDNFKITKIETTGEIPGWIHSHKAILNKEEGSITIEGGLIGIDKDSELIKNVNRWELDLKTKVWKKLTNRVARQLTFKRKDGDYHNLFDFYLFCEYHKDDKGELIELNEKLGFEVEPEIYEKLYEFNLPDIKVTKKDYDDIKIKVGNNMLEIDESGRTVDVLIMDTISAINLKVIKETILNNLERLERTEYVVEDVII